MTTLAHAFAQTSAGREVAAAQALFTWLRGCSGCSVIVSVMRTQRRADNRRRRKALATARYQRDVAVQALLQAKQSGTVSILDIVRARDANETLRAVVAGSRRE